MTIQSTGLTLPGIRAEFFDRLNATQTYYQDLATRIPSTTGTEKYRFLGSVPPMREWGGGRVTRGMYPQAYDVENLKYEITLEVDRDEIDDDQTGQIRVRINEMAEQAALHKDSLIGGLLINGATAGFHSYDGVPFFANNHASGISGTQNNLVGPAIVDKDAPTVAEFKASLKDAIARLMGFKNDQGQPMNLAATGLVVVVPPSMYFTALEAINATVIDSTTNVLSGAARVISFAHISATDTYYLLKTDTSVRPFIFQDRMPIEFKSHEENSEHGFTKEKFLYGVRARYRLTYGYWQHAVKVTFTTA